MKKVILMVMVTAVYITTSCYAQIVTVNEAKKVAQVYMGRDTVRMYDNIARVNTDYDREGKPLLHEVIMNDSTIVLVSGNKATTPILAIYKNAKGILESDILPCGLSIFIDFYRQTIALIAENSVHTENNDEWQRLLDGERLPLPRASVGPLLTTKWGQGASNDSVVPFAYNKLVSPDDYHHCQHCLAGCVAVSMGQVMNYYKWPYVTCNVDNFSEQFDWCHMPDKLISTSPRFDHQCDAVSRLLSTCGNAVGMRYGCTFSVSDNEHAKTALVEQFNYSTDVRRIFRLNTFLNLRTFLDSVKMSLDMGYPVIMGAYDRNDEGHSFVCDGYSGNKYRFNWGWNGEYNGLYSFNLWGNIEVWNHVFNQSFDALVFLHPTGNLSNDICNNEMHLEDFYTNYYSNHSPLVFYPYDNTPKTMSVLYSADIFSDTDWRTIPEYARDVEYRAYSDIYLIDGFTAKEGCEFTAMIDPCEQCETRNEDVTVDRLTHPETEGDNREDTLYAMPSFHELIADLYPNPTSGELTVAVEGEVQSIVIHNVMGQPVGGWRILTLTDNQISLDVTSLPSGPYVLSIRTADGKTKTAKLIKE
ncbi:MAG: C10 family peptidase [Bacteroidales bacterium]|nr:C10 family peptidase [Bacteroidales bacterium]